MKTTLLLRLPLLALLAIMVGGFQSAVFAQTTYVQGSDSLGLVVMQAEDFTVNNDGTGIKAGDKWIFANDSAGFNGSGYMESVMSAGDGDIGNAENFNAKLTFEVDFVHTGTHYFWARVSFPDGSGDSFFFGIDGSVADRVDGSPYGFFHWDSGNSTFDVDTVGPHTIDVMQREPTAIIDMIIVSSNANFDPAVDSSWYTPPVTYYQDSDSLGLVVIPAEGFTLNKAGTGSKAGDSWKFASDTAGYLGDGYMQSVMLGGGDGSTSNAETINAKLTYNVEFAHSGTHYLWSHVYYPGGSNDSYWFGLDGTVADRCDNSNWNNWLWDQGNSSFDVDTTGFHTFDVMQREPDAIVDMLIITRDPNFDPVTDSTWFYGPTPPVAMYNVVYVAPAASNDTVTIQAIEAYEGGSVFSVTVLEKSIIDSTDLAMLDTADVVVMGRNINSSDVGAAADVWDAIERPVMAMGLWGLRENRANWVPAGIGCENINGDTLVVNGIILNNDAVFGGLTDTIVWWNGSHSPFVPDSAHIAAGNGTLMVESDDLRPLFIRWNANQEFYPGAGHQPNHARSYMGIGNDNATPANYFGFSDDAAMIYFNELMRLAGMGEAPMYNVLFVTPSDTSLDAPVIEAIQNYNNGETFSVTVLPKAVIDSTDLSKLNGAGVVVMGRNIGSTDVAAGAATWDAVERPVLSMNMWGLRENRANWVPAGIGCENINGDTLVVNGIIQNSDAVFGGLTDTITWWNGSFSSFVADSAHISAGNGTLMVESEDLRPLFLRWNAFEEFYDGAGHKPNHIRSFMGMGNDNDDPDNYFGFSEDAAMVFYNELMMLAGQPEAVDTTTAIEAPIDLNVNLYPNPVYDFVNVQADFNIQRIRVLNIMGAMMMNEEVNTRETVLDLSGYARGVYFVIVEGKKGAKTFKVKKQ